MTDLTDKLMRNGIPREQIAAMGDADTDAKKQALFDKVRAGIVRVLIGSTQKMGTGTNVQKRLVALHHLDAPWKPAEVEQRDGRILRQGNMNDEVAIYRYVTEGSFDAYMWQALETKARFIAQVITGDSTARQAEDIGGQELSYAEVKAIASGNPAVLTLAEADAELKRLTLLKKHHGDEQYLARQALRELPEKIERLERRMAGLTQDRQTVEAHKADPLIIDGRPCPRDDIHKRLGEQLKTVPASVIQTRRVPLGVYRGLNFGMALSAFDAPEVYLEGASIRRVRLSRDHQGPRAILNAVERLAGTYDLEHRKAAQDLSIAQGQLRDFEARLGGRFAHESYLNELTSLRDQLELGLSGTSVVEGIVTRIMDLRAAHTVEAAPERTVRAASAEEPVTARIRQRVRPTSDTAAPEEAEAPASQTPQVPLATLFILPSESKPHHPPAQRSQHRKKYEASSQLSLF